MRRVVLLVLVGVLLGAALTALAAVLPGSRDVTPLTVLGTVATVAALVVAAGIYRVQQSQSDVAHQELLDALKAQDEILQTLADNAPSDNAPSDSAPSATTVAPTPPAAPDDDLLTSAQREAVQARYPDRSIDASRTPRGRRGTRGDRIDGPRLVRLDDGTLVTVWADGRGEMHVRQVRPRPGRDDRLRGRDRPAKRS